MADKLNQSLDEILSERRKNTRRPRGNRRGGAAANGTTRASTNPAPVGGVKKNVKGKQEKAVVPTGPSGLGESKVLLSNLPYDVTEQQIKEYFDRTIGPVKKAMLNYGPTGNSRGVATVIFRKAGSAAEAAAQMNGQKIDDRVMKVEVIVDAKSAPQPPPVKSLSERIAQPKAAVKAQPKPATVTKSTKNVPAGKTRGKARRGRNANRPKPKTAEELDAEMKDYFGNEGGEDAVMGNGGAVQPTINGGNGDMEDDDL